jgi:phosphoribosylaminoimidazole-succinocarboxamide synthase
MDHDFMGLENQTVPHLDDAFVELVSSRYIELFEKLTGTTFHGDTSEDPLSRINTSVEEWLSKR